MGDSQLLTPDEQIDSAREAYENGSDFTLAVEEEFAVLDPETLSLANRFEDLQAAARGTPLEAHLVGELIASEVEVRTGRCESVPDAYAGWPGYEDYVRFLYDTGSITEHTQIWWSVRPHLAFPTVEIRICDAQPDLEEARSLAALCYGLTARIARALDEGEPLPDHPHRLIEENFWRAIRYGLTGELIDLASGHVRPARAHLERLIEWIAPVAEELGAAQNLAVPAANSAERQITQHAEGATMEEIYAGLVRRGEPVRG